MVMLQGMGNNGLETHQKSRKHQAPYEMRDRDWNCSAME